MSRLMEPGAVLGMVFGGFLLWMTARLVVAESSEVMNAIYRRWHRLPKCKPGACYCRRSCICMVMERAP